MYFGSYKVSPFLWSIIIAPAVALFSLYIKQPQIRSGSAAGFYKRAELTESKAERSRHLKLPPQRANHKKDRQRICVKDLSVFEKSAAVNEMADAPRHAGSIKRPGHFPYRGYTAPRRKHNDAVRFRKFRAERWIGCGADKFAFVINSTFHKAVGVVRSRVV